MKAVLTVILTVIRMESSQWMGIHTPFVRDSCVMPCITA